MFQCREAVWKTPSNGRRGFYRLWEPADSRALAVMIHGFGEHGGRYEPFAQALAERRVTVVCPDLWGHGRSEGQRGDIERFSQYTEDLDSLFAQALAARVPPGRFAVFGHSFGGLVAAHWALRSATAFPALILQSPLLGVAFPVPAWKKRLGQRLLAVWPRWPLSTGLNPGWISRDPAVIEEYRRDPLVHPWITVRCYEALQAAMNQALEEGGRIPSPTLVLCGEEDRIISLSACKDFFQRLPGEKRLVTFPGCYHELHHEPVFGQVVDLIAEWIQTHA